MYIVHDLESIWGSFDKLICSSAYLVTPYLKCRYVYMNIFPRIYKGEGGEKVLHLQRGIHFLFN
jgi:hypothetical protein